MIDIEIYLSELADDELIAAFDVARNDLAAAAFTEPNSEWHQSCFAGVLLYAGEMQKRGLKAATVH